MKPPRKKISQRNPNWENKLEKQILVTFKSQITLNKLRLRLMLNLSTSQCPCIVNVLKQMEKQAEPNQIPLCNAHFPHKKLRMCRQQLLPSQENRRHSSRQSNKATVAKSEMTKCKHKPKVSMEDQNLGK